ncbi:cytochrome P450 4C1-like [Phymastichus coffea]|uniref:cytochrome P450 4C1-like n=1 Tax=Phymastichus coffea TaxID=108790 RepID=UPI00273BFE74|nr:cytochrome P450 4C1-like [Phymastichus coffea]XP_058806267.1 cytochrome P450 4C1-like [Phymastichus coffea]
MVVAMSSMLAIASAIFILAFILLYYVQRFRLYKESAKFPGPPNLPFIGSAHYFMGSTQDILNKCQYLLETYPSPFRVWLAGRLFYVAYDPEQLKTIFLSPKTIEKEDLYKFARPWLGTGLFTASASKWRIHRKLIMPTFNPRILESFVEVFSVQSEIMVREMEVEVNGGEFDIFHYVSLCTLDIICETAMGVSSNAQTQRNSAYVQAAKQLFEIIYSRMFKIWLHPDFIFNNTKLGKNMHECIKYVHGLTDDVIKRKKLALKNNENHGTLPSTEVKRKAFLDLLMELSHEGAKFTDEELREEVDTMMIAGNDTTATVNCFVMLMLASHPEIQAKVYEELREIYGSEDPCAAPVKYEDLYRMEYTERVIKETMRIFPVGPLLVRRVTDDLNIGEFTLTKGSSVVLGIIKTHRNEEIWKDPMTFNPDRFLPEECAKRHPYAYIPFSAGPRNCLGIKYAMLAMKVLLATVVRKYIIKKDNVLPIQDIKLKADIMLKPVDVIKIRIERRINENNKVD